MMIMIILSPMMSPRILHLAVDKRHSLHLNYDFIIIIMEWSGIVSLALKILLKVVVLTAKIIPATLG